MITNKPKQAIISRTVTMLRTLDRLAEKRQDCLTKEERESVDLVAYTIIRDSSPNGMYYRRLFNLYANPIMRTEQEREKIAEELRRLSL